METRTLVIGDERIRESLGRIPALYLEDLIYDMQDEIYKFYDEVDEGNWNIVGFYFFPRHYSLEITFRRDPSGEKRSEQHREYIPLLNFTHPLTDRFKLTSDYYEDAYKEEIQEFIAKVEKTNLTYLRSYFQIDFFDVSINLVQEFSTSLK